MFNTTIEQQGKARTASALLVAGVVLGILVGAALVGGPLLNLLGINLNAFSFVGGLIIFAMGIEMLYAGAPSRAQGGDIQKRVGTEGASQEDEGLIIPLSIPLIAGPGAIVTAITIAATGDGIDGTIAAITGAIAVAIVTFGSLDWLGAHLQGVAADDGVAGPDRWTSTGYDRRADVPRRPQELLRGVAVAHLAGPPIAAAAGVRHTERLVRSGRSGGC